MAIDDDIAFFERVPTLGLLGRQALRILAIGAETRQVDRGEVLFSAGEQADGGFVIQEGSFRLSDLAQTRLKRQAGLLTASTVGLPEVEVNVNRS